MRASSCSVTPKRRFGENNDFITQLLAHASTDADEASAMQVQNARWSDRLSSGRLTLESPVGDHQRMGDPTHDRNAIVGRGWLRRLGMPCQSGDAGHLSCGAGMASVHVP